MNTSACLIGLDWGTSSLRAYLLARDGTAIDRVERPMGILQVPQGDFDGVFLSTAGPWLARHPGLPAIACGMIGSRQGWREAPYAACPGGLDELARGIVKVPASSGATLHLIPGMSVTDPDGVPDVMRGEETQILGQFKPAERGVAVLPGTHSKWILVEDGRIQRFATFMTGEAFAALRDHTILGRLMVAGAEDPQAFARGVEHGSRAAAGRGGLLHRLFSARTLGLFEQLPGAAIPSYLSGLMIGTEIDEALAWLDDKPASVVVVGAPALTKLYNVALAQRGVAAQGGTPDAAALGMLRVARAARLV